MEIKLHTKDALNIINDIKNNVNFKALYEQSAINKDKWYYNEIGQIIITTPTDSIKVKFFNLISPKIRITNLDDYFTAMQKIMNNYYDYNHLNF